MKVVQHKELTNYLYTVDELCHVHVMLDVALMCGLHFSVLRRLVILISAAAVLQAESDAMKKQAEGATAAAKRMMEEKDNKVTAATQGFANVGHVPALIHLSIECVGGRFTQLASEKHEMFIFHC